MGCRNVDFWDGPALQKGRDQETGFPLGSHSRLLVHQKVGLGGCDPTLSVG